MLEILSNTEKLSWFLIPYCRLKVVFKPRNFIIETKFWVSKTKKWVVKSQNLGKSTISRKKGTRNQLSFPVNCFQKIYSEFIPEFCQKEIARKVQLGWGSLWNLGLVQFRNLEKEQ